MNIIGRHKEQQSLEKIFNSKEAEFVVIYGRRRVGKTYLIREFFRKKKGLFFHATGLQNGSLAHQLQKFSTALSEAFFDSTPLAIPKNWSEAFRLLHQQLIKNQKKITVFLDEFPWMATPKSGLLSELDYYWNHYWSSMPHLTLIVCGSSASWLIHKIIYNKGGLHNRVTLQLKLLPFSLAETQAYLSSRKIKLSHPHVLLIYIAIGGIPYYLRYVQPGLSVAENIHYLFFDSNAPLKDEFEKLFASLFDHQDDYIELIRLIFQKRDGISRTALKDQVKLSSGGGRLSKKLNDLVMTGFIDTYTPWGKTKGTYYKLVDEFVLFYLYWMDTEKSKRFTADHWITQSKLPSYSAWLGYTFESVCFKHSEKIIQALKIKSSSTVSTWRLIPRNKTEMGAQIDLLIDRHDDAITLCEIKYNTEPFVITKEYAQKLINKVAIFKHKTGTKKQLFLSLITAAGLKNNWYAEDLVHGIVVLEDLFKDI